jgi:hypothetical protein
MSYKSFFFVLLLILLGTFGYLCYQASQPPETYFNQTKRYSLGKSEFWRTVLNLNRPGDAKGHFLTGKDTILIEVVSAKGLDINEEGLRKFAVEVERITGHKTNIINVDLLKEPNVRNADLVDIVKSFRRHKTFGQPSIFVIYANDFEGSDNGPAKPFFEYGILLSDQKLKDLTSSYNQALRDYLTAVMLNSFGYQIGLLETKSPNCIMQDAVLKPTNAIYFYGTQLPSTYCDAEIEQAANIKASLE